MGLSWQNVFIFGVLLYLFLGVCITGIVLKQTVKPSKYKKNQPTKKVSMRDVVILVFLSPVLLVYNYFFG